MASKSKKFKTLPCIEWAGPKTEGYGVCNINGKIELITRLLLQGILKRGLMAGELALHKCDNRACIRPCHLYVGSRQQNIQDWYDRVKGYQAPQCHATRPYHSLGLCKPCYEKDYRLRIKRGHHVTRR